MKFSRSQESTNSVNNSRNQAVSSGASTLSSATSGLFGISSDPKSGPAPKSVSSLVRLALSSNFPSGLLNAAQSYPTLSGGTSSSSAADGSSNVHVMSDSDQVSLEEFLESCRHTSLLTELEDEEELPDAEDDDPNDENDDEVSKQNEAQRFMEIIGIFF